MSISYIFNFIWIIAWIIVGHMTWFALLAFLAAPLAFKTIHTLSTNTDEFQLDKAMGTTAGAGRYDLSTNVGDWTYHGQIVLKMNILIL